MVAAENNTATGGLKAGRVVGEEEQGQGKDKRHVKKTR